MTPIVEFLKFQNPNQGELLFAEVLDAVLAFMRQVPSARYKIMIGSDSTGMGTLDLVSVIAVHRVGNGGRYFWSRLARTNVHSLRQKIYAEVDASLSLAGQFLPAFRALLKKRAAKTEVPFDLEIHVDVGTKGETRDLIREVTGMVRGFGYEVFVKPESAAATSVADRHVR